MAIENNTNNQKQEVEVIIKRHKQLFDLLRHPNELWKVLLSLFLIIELTKCLTLCEPIINGKKVLLKK